MRKMIGLALVLTVAAACGNDGEPGEGRNAQRCDKKCQRANDEYIAPDQYTDYFVNDSDGKKDLVFYVVHDVPFPTAGEGLKCDVLKSFDAEGVGIAVVCPEGRATVAVSTGNQSNNDEQEDE